MPRLRFSEAANNDLESIAEYIAAAPIVMGRERNELRPGIRSHPHKSYVIFFRYVGDVLEIVHIIEGHRDVTALFGGDTQS